MPGETHEEIIAEGAVFLIEMPQHGIGRFYIFFGKELLHLSQHFRRGILHPYTLCIPKQGQHGIYQIYHGIFACRKKSLDKLFRFLTVIIYFHCGPYIFR